MVSDALLTMILKGLPDQYKQFSTVVTRRDKKMTFTEFKIALRSYEESEWSRKSILSGSENVMEVSRYQYPVL